MNTNLILTQIKRELWEHKVGFVYAPLIVSGLLMFIITFALIKFNDVGAVVSDALQDNAKAGSNHIVINQTGMDRPPAEVLKDFLLRVTSHGDQVYSEIVTGVIYANCALIVITFFIVVLGYAHGCLFDDRKNRDILFWRSMPVSETTNVLVKFGMLMLYFPVAIFALNVLVAIFVTIASTIFFSLHNVAIGSLLSSVIHSNVIYTLFKTLIMMVVDMLMLSPIIAFTLMASAYAKKSPFITTSLVPAVLMVLDKVVNVFTGINLHVIDAFSAYWKLFINTKVAVETNQVITLDVVTLAGYFISAIMCAGCVIGAIWLRNNRYEI